MQYTNDILQKVLTLFIGTGAVIGAMMMWIDPIGMMCGCEPLLQMLRDKMPWPNYSSLTSSLQDLCCCFLLVEHNWGQLSYCSKNIVVHPTPS